MRLKIWGEYGLFTRPEFKADPHSYPIITPTAARGVFKSIFWKPEFRYTLHRIVVLNPIRFMSVMRNMGQSKQSHRTAMKWAANGGIGRYTIDQDRSQRNHVVLKHPKYILDFNIDLEPHATDVADKYIAQFKRRVDRGQCFKQPCLGCREFVASFSWPDGDETIHPELMGQFDLGLMPKAMHYRRDDKGSVQWRDGATGNVVKGRVEVEMFAARMRDGVVEVV